MVLYIFDVSCIVERSHLFTEGNGVATYDTLLVVYARDEAHVRQLISDLEQGGVKIDIKTVDRGETTEQSEAVVKVYEHVTGSRLTK